MSGEWIDNVCQNPEAQKCLRQQVTWQSLKEDAGTMFMTLGYLVSNRSFTT